MRVTLEDLGADAIKTGMLHSPAVIERVAKVLADYADIPLVVDPVMRAKGGAKLLQDEAQAAQPTSCCPVPQSSPLMRLRQRLVDRLKDKNPKDI